VLVERIAPFWVLSQPYTIFSAATPLYQNEYKFPLQKKHARCKLLTLNGTVRPFSRLHYPYRTIKPVDEKWLYVSLQERFS
jgi:hypothetical protein